MDVERFLSSVDTTISALLREGRKEDALKQNPQLSSEIDELVNADPSGNLKYLNWQVKMLIAGEDINDVIDIVSLFHKHHNKLDKKDINAYSSADFSSLREKLSAVSQGVETRKSTQKSEREALRCQQKIVFEDDKVVVRHIMGKKASVHYGRGTKWCITMTHDQYFEQYTMNNTVFFFIIPKSEKKKSDDFTLDWGDAIGDAIDYDTLSVFGQQSPTEERIKLKSGERIAISCERDSANVPINIEFFDASDETIGEGIVASSLGYSRWNEIKDIVLDVASNYPRSALSKLMSGVASVEDIVNIYTEIISPQLGVYDETSERIISQILESPKELPPKIVNDIVERLMMPNYGGANRYDKMLYAIDRKELWPSTIYKMTQFDFRYFTEKFLYELFSARSDIPDDVYEKLINDVIDDSTEIYEYHILAIKKMSEMSVEMQRELASQQGDVSDVANAFFERAEPLDQVAVTTFVDKLVAKHFKVASYDDKVKASSRSSYSDVLEKLLERDDWENIFSPHIKSQLAKIPSILRKYKFLGSPHPR